MSVYPEDKKNASIVLRDNLIILIFVAYSTCHSVKDKNETMTVTPRLYYAVFSS